MNHRSISRFTLSLMLAMTFLAAALPGSAMAASNTPTVACAKTHTIKSRDTTRSLALLYGMPWGDIARANNLTQPYTLTPGNTLCIPYKKGLTPLNGTIVMTVTADKLNIKASNFKQTQVFFVKAKDGLSKTASYSKIGTLTVEKTKNPKVTTFTLPGDLRKVAVLSVCLKNVYTDDLTCFSVLRH